MFTVPLEEIRTWMNAHTDEIVQIYVVRVLVVRVRYNGIQNGRMLVRTPGRVEGCGGWACRAEGKLDIFRAWRLTQKDAKHKNTPFIIHILLALRLFVVCAFRTTDLMRRIYRIHSMRLFPSLAKTL